MRIPRTIGRHRTPSTSREGFTLVEIMVALMVLAIGILGMGQLLIVSQRHSNFGRQQSISVSLAQEIKERIYAEDFDDVKNMFDNTDTASPGSVNQRCGDWATHVSELLGIHGRGRIQVSDTNDDATLPAGMLRVEILIDWQEGPTHRQLPHTFLISKVGL